MLGVGLGVCRALDPLGGVGDFQGCVAGHLHEGIVEGIRGVDRVHDLFLGAPALGRALLEEAPGIRTGEVAVADVPEFGFLHGGGQGNAGCPRRQPAAHGDSRDQGGVCSLVRGQVGVLRTGGGGAFLGDQLLGALQQ